MDKVIKVLDVRENSNISIEIVEIPQLKGSQNLENAMQLFLAQQAGLTLKQIRIKLRDGSIKTEAGALYFSKGNINCDTQIGGVGGVIGKMFKSTLNKEAVIKPVYSGYGEVYLEPTFGHFIMLELQNDSIVVDKGMFYCCSAGMKVEPVAQSNISSALLGGEGIFQTEISGTGIVVLEIPVPKEEILMYELKGDRVQVDGNFAILRSKNIRFSVQKSSKSLMGSFMNGEGLLQTFEGTGMVWLAPTAPVYRTLSISGYSGVNITSKSMNNNE